MTSRSSLSAAFGLMCAYALLAGLAIHLSRQPDSIAVVWFANALGIAWVAHAVPRRWPALAAATFAGTVVANLAMNNPLPMALTLSYATANTAEVMLGGWLLQRYGLAGRLFDSPRALLLALATGGLVPQLLGTTLGTVLLLAGDFGNSAVHWPDWYVGSALGAVMMLPLAMLTCQLGAASALRQLATPKMLVIVAVVVGLAVVDLTRLPYPFIVLCLMGIAAALLLPPLASFFVCFVLALTVTTSIDLGVLKYSGGAVQGLEIYLPALLSVLPGQLLTVAQEQQRRAHRTLGALTSATNDLLMYFDLDGKIRVVNRTWEHYRRREMHEVVGMSPLDVVPPEHRASSDVAGRIERSLAGEVVTERVALTFPILGRRTLDVGYHPAFGPDQERVGVVFTGHDVTDMVAAQDDLERTVAELRRANDGLEQFARIASHDLREPLNTIAQFSGLIEQDENSALSPTARRYFEQVKSGAERMRVMLDDLLGYVRLDHIENLALTPIDLNEPVAQALLALTARIDARRATVEVDALPRVSGQASLLTLLFQNLVSNAVKFVPAERAPHVRISVRDGEPGLVVVSIEDNGIGIEADDVGKLFEPFRRLHARRRFDGTGLGLAICRRIATAHGGTIELHSQPGTGTRVDVTLRRG